MARGFLAILVLLCLSTFALSVQAQDILLSEADTLRQSNLKTSDAEHIPESKLAPKFALAMHGTSQYDENSAHLSYANPDAPKGGHLKQAAIGTFDTINPYSIRGRAAQGLNLVYDRLMARVWDEPFTMVPLIAERYEMAEDRSWIIFHINPQARFHNGAPIKADDVLFSFETLKTDGRPNMRNVYRLVESAESIGDLSVKFAFGEGYDEETALIIAMMPILSKAWWEGRVFDSTTLDIPNLNGAYTISAIDAGRSITFKRKEDYWARNLMASRGHFNFDTITFEYFRDDTVAFEAFKAGHTDIRRESDIGRWSSGYDFPALTQGRVVKDAIPHQRPERVNALIMNTRRAPFDDLRVRQALNLLFDFEWANRNLFHGQYKRISSFFPNSELAAQGEPSDMELEILERWRDDIPQAVFGSAYAPPVSNTPEQIRKNMRKADELLKQAGWLVEKGKRVKNGQVFSFEILLSAPEDEKLALHFKRALDRMGIQTHIRVLDNAAYRGRLNGYDFDMTLYFWQSSLSPGTEQILYWGCQAAEEPARWNFPGICNPAIDHIAAQVAQAKTRESLVAHIHALDRILTHNQYIIPLYYSGHDYFSYAAKISRPEESPIYGAVLETWWMNTVDE
ncbi:MAG: extracellular solute-binding protein [Alphaproteobacteria bacterium]